MQNSRVVVGVDATVESRCAVAWCARMLGSNTEVVAVAAMSKFGEFVLGLPGFDEDPAAHMLGRAETNWTAPLHTARVPVRIRFEEDATWRAIVTVATDEHADLIVVGKQHRNMLAKLINPSDADLLVHHAPCSVLIVPATVDAGEPLNPASSGSESTTR